MQKKFGKAFDFHPDTFQVTLKSLLASCLFVSDCSYLGSSIGIGLLGYMWLLLWQSYIPVASWTWSVGKEDGGRKMYKGGIWTYLINTSSWNIDNYVLHFRKIMWFFPFHQVYIVKLPNNMCGIGACVIDSPSKVILPPRDISKLYFFLVLRSRARSKCTRRRSRRWRRRTRS